MKRGLRVTIGLFVLLVLMPAQQNVTQVPTTSATPAFASAPYTNNATSTSAGTNVKSSAGNVYAATIVNPNASTCWLQFYNNASTPTVGTSVIFAIPILASGGLRWVPAFPVNFATGIAIATTTTATGSTECSTGMGVELEYQ